MRDSKNSKISRRKMLAATGKAATAVAVTPALQSVIVSCAMAKDALALFPASEMKQALEEAVEFCIARAH